MSAPLPKVTVHTDGGCLGNPGVGAWAAVLRSGPHVRELAAGVAATTNNRMELSAAIEALNSLKRSCAVTLHTDSQYVRNGITTWISGWKRNGWKTASKQPVKNADLWQQLELACRRHEVEWKWVKGHAGVADNERCDELAGMAMEEIKSQFSRAALAEALEAFKRTQ